MRWERDKLIEDLVCYLSGTVDYSETPSRRCGDVVDCLLQYPSLIWSHNWWYISYFPTSKLLWPGQDFQVPIVLFDVLQVGNTV